ncbi:MAG: hypothetical protein IJ277_02245, partial [Bacteroidaceae bacterium]|nr:hypothetical protein [Bacteroidaceae bacterium]
MGEAPATQAGIVHSNKRIVIDEREATSDANGFVNMYIPLKEQKQEYRIESNVPLNENSIVMP